MISPANQAIGALKLAVLNIEHPGTVSPATVTTACTDAASRLQSNQPHADDLVRLYSQLLAVTPPGYWPHVTLVDDAPVNFGCVITDAAGNVVDRQVGKTTEGITEMIRLRFTRPTAENKP
ncbi:MAG: hypothetical protein KJ989_15380 [Gammaproteobacteria bacterium]|uniref:Uncharacterized protein n=1 Tax=viral metagenome TaxID=1070528 RepID=A0A6M3J6B8_9ZZZZ|nr:hypothetical protein [Gammaproteobacteria bacterium]MBU2067499.1 hypothetical protein [Gammaproteobacteria bacterium]MBU2139509.1 hypothetical protein [Gammaproteobacteria bacterium]MBU2255937.1 hypothetical protein [Gammaproteobacteria bacterium]MBU2295582.1 hypothetical protein [Gammaproteobacteria bacterium]